ncbi:MAG: hypothetical protein V7767_09980 [Leeuwenhoekiella sp.]
MKIKNILTFFILGCFYLTSAQVGINNTSPAAMLDVTGNVKVENKLFLENPGEFNIIRGSKLLIQKTNTDIVEYDIPASKYGPINYAQLVFQNTSATGLQDYDTKISTSKYYVTIQGYYFLQNGNNATSVLSSSLSGDDYVEGFQVYAYPNSSTNTWYIRAFINNGSFKDSGSNDINVDLYLNTIIYRNGFITKSINDVSVNMGGSSTATVPLPVGF